MKKAIEFLRAQGIEVNDNGLITSAMPNGEDGLLLVDQLEEASTGNDENDFWYYGIVCDSLQKFFL